MKGKTNNNYVSFNKLLNIIKDQNFEYEIVKVNELEAGKYYLSAEDRAFDNFQYALSILQEANSIFKKGNEVTNNDYSRLHEIHCIIFENYDIAEALEIVKDNEEWEAADLYDKE